MCRILLILRLIYTLLSSIISIIIISLSFYPHNFMHLPTLVLDDDQ